MLWKLQTTFSNLSSMKVFEFQLQFHWSLFPRVQLIVSQHWFRLWLDTEQARNQAQLWQGNGHKWGPQNSGLQICLQGDQRTRRVDGLCGFGSMHFGSDSRSFCTGLGGPPVAGCLGGWLLLTSTGLSGCLLRTWHVIQVFEYVT